MRYSKTWTVEKEQSNLWIEERVQFKILWMLPTMTKKKSEEGQKVQQPKLCEYNNQDEDNSLNYANNFKNP